MGISLIFMNSADPFPANAAACLYLTDLVGHLKTRLEYCLEKRRQAAFEEFYENYFYFKYKRLSK